MKIALISDLHSNLEALTAVLEDIEKNDVRDIYCLGDIVGYGPNPNEVLEMSRISRLTLLGNHDGAAYNGDGIENFNWIAAMAANWTRKEIEPDPKGEPDEKKATNWEFISQLKQKEIVGRVLFAHGSCTGNKDYIFKVADAGPTFQYMATKGLTTCFVGHTHIPCVITEGGEYFAWEEGADYPRVGMGERLIINVGSVGQPRDVDWRACYVIMDGPVLTFRRVKYDLETTIEKIYKIDELNNFLGDRLRKKE